MTGVVGPMSLAEHVAWFVVLSLVVFLVANGLRIESIREAIVRGLRRWVAFVGGTIVLGLIFHVLSAVL